MKNPPFLLRITMSVMLAVLILSPSASAVGAHSSYSTANTVSGGHITVTSGNGTFDTPYRWNVARNHTYVGINTYGPAYSTVEGYTLHLLVQLHTSNWTDEYPDGYYATTGYYLRFRYECTADSWDVTANCQNVSFTVSMELPGTTFQEGQYNCSNGRCQFAWDKWSANYYRAQGVDSPYGANWDLWKFRWNLTNIWGQIHGHWLHVAGWSSPWFQGRLLSP